MTDCALAPAPAPARPERVDPRRRPRPAGVPWWVRLLGVALVPLEDEADPTAPRAWALSAGAGTSHVAALLVDESTDH